MPNALAISQSPAKSSTTVQISGGNLALTLVEEPTPALRTVAESVATSTSLPRLSRSAWFFMRPSTSLKPFQFGTRLGVGVPSIGVMTRTQLHLRCSLLSWRFVVGFVHIWVLMPGTRTTLLCGFHPRRTAPRRVSAMPASIFAMPSASSGTHTIRSAHSTNSTKFRFSMTMMVCVSRGTTSSTMALASISGLLERRTTSACAHDVSRGPVAATSRCSLRCWLRMSLSDVDDESLEA
ncbi:hypothetical protein L249_8623 [Ophiocordyceps polyrhachis-furcata BCC 54312]|uniref:Uncharacterized protein n=1 Tax=Ophiocordyceps polyrhachis-furcata BCC 54312 TaxID=1330021 RepID=A0A367L6Y9_9HYPO|nr:hypothetical protein L249_8623 [Ophiocordyceps polyrhachis-furcata BCC 54312]